MKRDNSSEGALIQKLRLVEDRRHPDVEFQFQIWVPRSWNSVELPRKLTTGHFQTWLRFVAPEDSGVSVEVELSCVTREVAAADWVQIALEERGEMILGAFRLPTTGGEMGVFDSRVGSVGSASLRRSVAIKDQNRIWMISARADESTFNALSHVLCAATASFRLKAPSVDICAEPLETYQAHATRPYSFSYPTSWEVLTATSQRGSAVISALTTRGPGQ